jgi:hypothetical protein
MILIPDRLRSKSEISAAAVTDCHIISGSALSAVHFLKFLSINNNLICHDIFSFLSPDASASGFVSLLPEVFFRFD